MRTVGMIILSV